LSGESFFNAILASTILILEGETHFEEIHKILTNYMLEKRIRFPTQIKFDIIKIYCYLPHLFDWNVARFFLEGLAEFPPQDMRALELDDRLAKTVQSLEALFAKENQISTLLINGLNFEERKQEPLQLKINLPAKLIPVWKKSEEVYRMILDKRKPLYQISLLEDRVAIALNGYLKGAGKVLTGGHFICGFEVDIVVDWKSQYILVEVNGKTHYYRNQTDRLNYRTKGKENFFAKTKISFIPVGMIEWNKEETKNDIFERLFKKYKLKSEFLNTNKDEKEINSANNEVDIGS
jgi:hypothetical protein